ncbi:MAG TPA: hypothetical protein VIO81_13735, partial [Methyloversatilis sp.]
MNRIFATMLLAILAYGSASQAFGECNEDTKSYIQKSGGNREATIAHTRKLVANAKLNQSGPFWKLPKQKRQEMFDAMDEDANGLIADIQSCSEGDLASIAPKAKGTQS